MHQTEIEIANALRDWTAERLRVPLLFDLRRWSVRTIAAIDAGDAARRQDAADSMIATLQTLPRRCEPDRLIATLAEYVHDDDRREAVDAVVTVCGEAGVPWSPVAPSPLPEQVAPAPYWIEVEHAGLYVAQRDPAVPHVETIEAELALCAALGADATARRADAEQRRDPGAVLLASLDQRGVFERVERLERELADARRVRAALSIAFDVVRPAAPTSARTLIADTVGHVDALRLIDAASASGYTLEQQRALWTLAALELGAA